MYNRLIIKDLHKWKNSPARKPLILRGARQVGKTIIARMFGKTYEYFSELNLEKAENTVLFKRGLTPHEIIQALKLKDHIPADVRSWLLFFDEIQACPEAVSLLRYFYEECPDVHIIAAGSLLEVALNREHISFPVGRVEFRYVYPMNFEEFIEAIAHKEALDVFHQVPSPAFAEEELFSFFHQYALIGGMPAAVSEYSRTNDVVAVNRVYEDVFTGYVDDVSKYARNDSMARVLRHCLKAAPFNAGKRITFAGFGESNYRSRESGEALKTLEQVMLLFLLYPTVSVHAPFVPCARKSPRLQFVDTGLLHYLSGIQQKAIGIQDLSAEFRGGLLEQLIGQELIATRNDTRKIPLFWVREKTQSQAEIDFMEMNGALPLPIEVKSGAMGRLRSLHSFLSVCPEVPIAVRLYRGSFSSQTCGNNSTCRLLNIPYYHVAKIQDYMSGDVCNL